MKISTILLFMFICIQLKASVPTGCGDFLVLDGAKKPLIKKRLHIYLVQKGQPDKVLINHKDNTDVWVTDNAGFISFKNSLPKNEIFQIKVIYDVNTKPVHPNRNLNSNYKNAFIRTIDNGVFISNNGLNNEIKYEVNSNEIWLRHTELSFNLTVSIQWDADQDYINKVAASMRELSDFIYDYTDGQAKIDTVNVFDNSMFYAGADIRIDASNYSSPAAFRNGYLFGNKYIQMPRNMWFKTQEEVPNQRNLAIKYPYVLGDNFYRALGHEAGHYMFDFNEEYEVKDESGVFVEYRPNWFGLMESPFPLVPNSFGVPGSEISNKTVYDYHSVNTRQLDEHKLSAFGLLKKNFSKYIGGSRRSIVNCKIWEPEEQIELLNNKIYVDGPRLLLGSPSSKMHVIINNAGNDPKERIIKMWYTDDLGTKRDARAAEVKIFRNGLGLLPQGLASDDGQLLMLGVEDGNTVFCTIKPTPTSGIYATSFIYNSSTMPSEIELKLIESSSSSSRISMDMYLQSMSEIVFSLKDTLGIEMSTRETAFAKVYFDKDSVLIERSSTILPMDSNSFQGTISLEGGSKDKKGLFAHYSYALLNKRDIDFNREISVSSTNTKFNIRDTACHEYLKKILLVETDFHSLSNELPKNYSRVSKVSHVCFYPELAKVKGTLILNAQKAVDIYNTELYEWNGIEWKPSGQKVHTDPISHSVYYHINSAGTFALFENVPSTTKLSIDSENDMNYTIFPNPASNIISIEMTGGKVDRIKLVMMDISGKVVWEIECNELDQVKLPKLNSGLYMMRLTDISTNNSKTVKIVIKQ